nr:reverse transcriptase domain-containing protein [Tanacetum cinerariifolium]
MKGHEQTTSTTSHLTQGNVSEAQGNYGRGRRHEKMTELEQEKLKAVKARFNFEEISQYSDWETPDRRRNLKERLGPRLRDKEKNVSAHSRGSERKSYYISRRDTDSCYQSFHSKETEIASEKRRYKREYSQRTEAVSESLGSAEGHWKSKPKKQKSSVEDDLSQPWVREEIDPFTPQIRYFDLPKARMPSISKHMTEGASECIKIFGFMHEITNPELIKRLHDKIPKSMNGMMSVTTAFLRGEVAASNPERKKSFPSWKQHEARQKQNFNRGNFQNEQRRERKQDRFTLLTKTLKEILALDKGKFKPPSPMTTPVEKRNAIKFCEFHGEVGHTTDKYQSKKGETSGKDKPLAILMIQPWQRVARQRITQTFSPESVITFPNLGEEDGTEGPMIIKAEIGGHCVHRMYVDGGSFAEILYEHCFSKFRSEIKNQMLPANTSLVGFSGEIIWPLGQISLLVKIVTEEKIQVAIHPEYPEQTIAIGFTLTEEGRKELYRLLRRHLDVFAWKPANMTGVPRHVAEHRLNVREGCLPIRQKKRGQAPERNRAIGEEVKKLVEAGIMKEVHYHSWLSNPVMVKKHDDSCRIDIEETFKTLKKINMKLNPKKCAFGMREGTFLGYKVDADGLRVCPDKVEAVLSLPSLKCLKNVQKLNGKLASLNRFLSKSVEKSLPFFKTLKKCTNKSDLQWTTEAEMAFKEMKQLIVELPMLTAPKEKEELIMYMVAAKEAISLVLMTERDGKQVPIYFVSRRLLKWRFELGEHDIQYRPRTLVKRQIMADFIVEHPEDDTPDIPMEDNEELPDPWILFTDGSSCIDGSGAGFIITNLKGMEFTYALSTFKEFSIKQIPRGENKKADALSKIASSSFAHLSKQVLVEELREKSIDEKKVLAVVEERHTWMTLVYEYLTEGILPEKNRKQGLCVAKQEDMPFGLPGEIVSDNGKQFRDYPFKDWCEKLSIHQYFASVKHPQANGLVERANRSLREGIKARLGDKNKNWVEEISHVLWAHRTMIKSSNRETLFSLTYGAEAVIPAEIGMPTLRTAEIDMAKNNEALGISLDLLEEKREQAAIQEARSKAKMKRYYNARFRSTSFSPGDFVYQSDEASHAKDGGKLGPK